MFDVEIDCLEYVTGSVARKFLSKYPNLGEKVGNFNESDSSWNEQMSKGNLIKPSKSMIQVAKVLEVVFNEYHTKNISRKNPGMHILYYIFCRNIKTVFIDFQFNTFLQES